jgi:hypothetical protein
VLGLLLEGAQRLQQEQATQQRWQETGEALLATHAEGRRVLQARKREVAHVMGQERNGVPITQTSDEMG